MGQVRLFVQYLYLTPSKPHPKVEPEIESKVLLSRHVYTLPHFHNPYSFNLTAVLSSLSLHHSTTIHCRLSPSFVFILCKSPPDIDYDSTTKTRLDPTPDPTIHHHRGRKTIPRKPRSILHFTSIPPRKASRSFASIPRQSCLHNNKRSCDRAERTTMPSALSAPVLTVDVGLIHKVDTRNVENLFSMWTGECTLLISSQSAWA